MYGTGEQNSQLLTPSALHPLYLATSTGTLDNLLLWKSAIIPFSVLDVDQPISEIILSTLYLSTNFLFKPFKSLK